MADHVDRFHAALSVLAGHGHIKQRLIKAYEDNLVEIDEDDIPVALKQTFADLRQSMHRVSPHNGESHVCASVRKMSVDEASECAIRLVSLYGEISRWSGDAQVSLPRNDETPPRIPPFLVESV